MVQQSDMQELEHKMERTRHKEDAACLYVGKVMHARLKPFGHRFTYSVFNLLIDIERLDDADRQSKLFSVNRKGILSFQEQDHGAETDCGLASFIRAKVAEQAPDLAIEQIKLLCYPRVLGYVFNPISIFYCLNDGDIVAMVYEVRNTFGNKHIYVAPVENGQLSKAGLRQKCDKTLHVSPFVEMAMTYFFHVSRLGKHLRFRILETDAESALLSATLKADRQPLTTKTVSTQLVKIPFLTLKVMAGIHFEALRLWVKGAKFIPNPHKKKGTIDSPIDMSSTPKKLQG